MVDPATDERDSSARGAAGTPGPPGQSGVDTDPDPVAKLFDAVSYAAATTVAFAVVSGVLAVLVGWQFAPGVKYGLFVFGWLAFGYGLLLLWPKSPWKDDDDEGRSVDLFDRSTGRPDTRFQRLVQRLPPARFRQIPHKERLSVGARIFTAAVVMLVTSFVLEQAFGVGP